MIELSAHGGPFSGGVPLESKPFMTPVYPTYKTYGSGYMYSPNDGLIYNPNCGLMAGTVKSATATTSLIDVTNGKIVNLGHPSTQSGQGVNLVGFRNNGDLILTNLSSKVIELHSVNKTTGALTFIRSINPVTLGYLTDFQSVRYSAKADMIIVFCRNTATNTSKIVCIKGDCSSVLWSANIVGSTNYPEVGAIFSDGVTLYVAGQIQNTNKLFLISYSLAGAITKALTEIVTNCTTYNSTSMTIGMSVVRLGNDLLITSGNVEYGTNNAYGMQTTIIDFTTWALKVSTANYARFFVAGYDNTNLYFFYPYQIGLGQGSVVPRATLSGVASTTNWAAPRSTSGSGVYGFFEFCGCVNQVGFEFKHQAWWLVISTGYNPSSGYSMINMIKKG